MECKKTKIIYKKLIIFLLFVLFLLLVFLKLISLKISNIYIEGNSFLSDQDIIESAGLQNYPNAFFTFSKKIESKLLKNNYISKVDVHKKFTKIYISIVENRPILYNDVNGNTVLMDGNTVSLRYDVPILTNSVSTNIYDSFLRQLATINSDVYSCISEISYVPNEVDNSLFLFTMNDGNYIYVNIDKFSSVNKYFDMVVNFNNRKGILYLDSGEYFKILDN